MTDTSGGVSLPSTVSDNGLVVEQPSFLRDKILSSNDTPVRLYHSDVWEVDIELRGMTGAEKAKYLGAMNRGGDQIDWQKIGPALLISCCWSPARTHGGEWVPGKSTLKLFRSDDEALINSRAGVEVERIARLCQKLSGLGTGDDLDADAEAPVNKN